jgi:hypothetical protein
MNKPAAAALVLVVTTACGGESPASPDPPQRSFAMGFADFPHARTLEAVNAALEVIRRDGDMAVMHFDDGVPWAAALAGSAYPDEYQKELERKVRGLPPGHIVYLAITPIAFARNKLAAHKGGTPWDDRSFDDPEVIAAFTAHAERMIAMFAPQYFAYGVEANMLVNLAPDRWPGFVRLARAVYSSVKSRHPALPVFLTLQADYFHADRSRHEAAVAEILPYTDFVTVSTYPFPQESDPRRLRSDHFTALAALASAKPFAVSETAWPAEDVSAPYPAFIPGSEENQRVYVDRLLADADRLSAVFVTYFFTRDYDDLWLSDMQYLPEAPLLRLWKDTGIYAGDGRARAALASWRAALARPRGR